MGRQKLELIFGRVLLLYQMPKAGSQTIEATLREARERPAIRHFTGTAKPWSDDERPADAGVYWEHRAATPFARA